jgi:TRAP-type uncharacterized transport system fused permease subunit
MIHGFGLGGVFLLLFSSVFHCLWSLRSADNLSAAMLQTHCRFLARITVLMAVILWLTIFVGTYINFPDYRANPPAGAADLTTYPKALLMANPDTKWLHEVGMETKEHMPWVAAMLMTAVAFVAARYQTKIVEEAKIRSTMLTLLTVVFGVVALVGLLGVFINKVAPLF